MKRPFEKLACGVAAGVLVTCMKGCGAVPYLGVALHSEGLDAPEVKLENPIGIAGIRIEIPEARINIEHHSGLIVTEEGYGYTFISFQKDLFQ